MKAVNPHELGRIALIEALRPLLRSVFFQEVTRERSTAELRALLAYHQSSTQDQQKPCV